VRNTWQGNIIAQLFEINFYACGTEPDGFCGIADTQHTHTLARDERTLPERLQRVSSSIMLGYHAEAGRTAVHGV